MPLSAGPGGVSVASMSDTVEALPSYTEVWVLSNKHIVLAWLDITATTLPFLRFSRQPLAFHGADRFTRTAPGNGPRMQDSKQC